MFGEVVTPHEAFLALGTLEAFVPWEEEMAVTHRHCPGPPRRGTRDLKRVMSKKIAIVP